ncbi:MAG: cytochrome d ubiquinol oxidase subunit II [Lentimicrobiaceae bacterium]|nr:cytochrome d ubiquinol oxidase subunit II [Lentimicrobiaceae bacterium]
MDYGFFQHYWWFLISLLGALLVFLMFVQGGQSLIYRLGKTDDELKLMLDALGKKWELTFTTLVTFGGAFFASFPLFYSTSFGGAYWVWILILLSFVIQAVSFEFIHKKGNLLGKNTYKAFLFTNGLLAPILIGAAVSTFFFGAEFTVNRCNITDINNPIISQWSTKWHGLEAIWGSTLPGGFHLWNVVLGLAIFFLVRALGALYFINTIRNEEIESRARKHVLINAVAFLIFFLPYLVRLLLKDGWTGQPDHTVVIEEYKYLNTLLANWWMIVILLVGVVGVLYGFVLGAFSKTNRRGFWFAGAGTVFVVLIVLLTAGFNGSAYYPSLSDPNSSLTIANSSSSLFTLKTMSVVSLFIPFVLAYISYVWKKMNFHI